MFTKYQILLSGGFCNQSLRSSDCASVVKPKTPHALGIAVDFVGVHLKDKKATEFNTYDKLLSEDLGLLIPFPTIQVISPESVPSVS